MPTDLITLIHGIRTKKTDPSWPKHFTGYVLPLPAVKTEAIYYETGPFPVWNNTVRNPRLARELASRIEMRAKYGTFRHHVVAHSNGTNVAVLLMRRLAKAGIRTQTAVLTGSALHSDVEKNGLADLVARGYLDRAVAYISPDDFVVGHLQKIPGFYGSLGARGFTRWGKECGVRVEGYHAIASDEALPSHFVTRTFEGFSHGEYFDAAEREACFRCILGDLRIDPVRD